MCRSAMWQALTDIKGSKEAAGKQAGAARNVQHRLTSTGCSRQERNAHRAATNC